MQSTIGNAQSAIESSRLCIVPFTEEYLTPRYVGWLNDPEVVRFSEQRHHVHTLESCRAYLRSFTGTSHSFWAIVAKDPEIGHIGNMNAYVDAANGVADMGILIGERSVWGQGYGSEAWNAVCRHLLHACGLRKVTAGTLSVNVGMRKLMERAGMTIEEIETTEAITGRRVRQVVFEGQEVHVIYAALFAGETISADQERKRP